MLVGGELVEQVAPQALVAPHVERKGVAEVARDAAEEAVEVGRVKEPKDIRPQEAVAEKEGGLPVAVSNCLKKYADLMKWNVDNH